MKKIAVFVLFISFFTLLFGCEKDDKGEIASIAIAPYAFKQIFYVDDILDVTGANLLITYENGDTEKVEIRIEWVNGFDTVTTGAKTLTVSYLGFTTPAFPYTVYVKDNPEKEIKTATRLDMYQKNNPTYKEFSFAITHCDLEGIYALRFTMEVEGATLSDELSELVIIPEYQMFSYAVKKKTENSFSVLLYSSKVTLNDCLFLSMQIVGGNASGITNVVLYDITATDKVNDYALPDWNMN